MKLLQFCVLYIWISNSVPEKTCVKNCRCGGTGSNSYIDCSGQRFMYFSLLLFKIPLSVEQIILRNNNIEHFPQGGIGKRLNVWSFDMSENKIINIEGNVLKHMFPNLRYLNLSRNQIRQIKRSSFFGLKLLRTLYLDNNQINLISKDAFDSITDLSYLNLAYNQLMLLDFRWFRNLKLLISLHLEGNEIERVESWIYTWPPSLKRLNLNNNRIPMILPIPKHAEMFNLEGNPTYCGCYPENVHLNDISNVTLCKVKMQCDSLKLKGYCTNIQLFKEVLKFWKDIAAKPICRAPVIKELALVRNREGMKHLTCVARGVPAPDITLYSATTEQKIHVHGVETTNITSATMNQLFSGTYHCNASNILDAVTRTLVVDLNELEVDDDCTTTDSTLSLTSRVPFLSTDSLTETKTRSIKPTGKYFRSYISYVKLM